MNHTALNIYAKGTARISNNPCRRLTAEPNLPGPKAAAAHRPPNSGRRSQKVSAPFMGHVLAKIEPGETNRPAIEWADSPRR